MDARIHDVGKLFHSTLCFVVPLYQRPYVWNQSEQWEPFWTDMRTLADEILESGAAKPHFMGAVVVDVSIRPTGGVDRRLVVDGQQRLTTIQIFLEALADNCERAHDEGCTEARVYVDRARTITRNQHFIDDGPGAEFKVWPMNLDQRPFEAVMTVGSPTQLRADHAADAEVLNSRIAAAYIYFYEQIEAWLKNHEDVSKAIAALDSVVNQYLQVVVIDLQNSVDPQLIFETLNARGTPLTPSDLIKNFLFHRAVAEDADGEGLYAQFWKPFEDEHGYWNTVVGKGKARTERLNVFMHQYLVMKAREDVQTGRRLYSEYRRYSDATDMTTIEQLAELERFGKVFRGLDELPQRQREAIFIARLRAMENNTVMPFVLALMGDASVARSDRVKIMEYLESYLVRRMVCNLTTKAYNRTFVDLLQSTDVGGMTPDAVRSFMLAWTEDTNRWPDDAEFRASWLDNKIYNQLALARLRMILLAIEPHIRSDKAEELAYIEDKLTVEHLLPQKWQRHYPLPADGRVDEIERERLLHTFGNLTLLTTKLNSSVSNGAWSTAVDLADDKGKRAAILKDAGLGISRMLADYPLWDDAAIRRRGEKLFKAALKVWPRPVE